MAAGNMLSKLTSFRRAFTAVYYSNTALRYVNSQSRLHILPATSHRSFYNSTVKAQSVVQEIPEESVNESTLGAKKTRYADSQQHRETKFRSFKTKPLFLKHLNDKTSKGEVFTVAEAFGLLKSCGPRMVGERDEVRNEIVNQVWTELKNNGIELEIGLWNTLLSVYVENRHTFEPLEFLKELWETSTAEPNKTTFSLLIQAYATKGDPSGAMKIVDFMMKNNARMTEHIYAWLVQAFAKKGDMNGVEEILASMKENNLKPKHATYSALINAHAERGELDKVNETMNKMIESNFFPTAEIYVNLLDHLSRGGHSQLIPTVWQKISDIDYMQEDIQPLIQRCITRGDYQSALELTVCSVKKKSARQQNYIKYLERKLFNMLEFCEKDVQEFIKMSALVQEKFATSSRLMNITEYFVLKNKPDVAMNLLQSLHQENKIALKTQSFHPIVQYYAEKEDLESVVEVFGKMVDYGVPIDYYCCRFIQPVVGKYGSENHQKLMELLKDKSHIVLPYNFVNEMVEDNEDVTLAEISDIINNATSPDLFSSLKSIKKILLRDFNPQDATKVVLVLNKKGMKDAAILVDELIGNILQGKNIDKVIVNDVFVFVKSLIENNIKLYSQSYTKMLKALHAIRNSDQFFLFVRLMKEHGIEPDVHQYYQMLKMAATVGNSMAAQFCFDKVKESDAFPNRKNEFYQLLIIAYSRDNESAKVIPAYIQGRDSENAHKVCQLFEEMQDLGYEINGTCISLAIRSYLANNDIDTAKQVIQKYSDGKFDESSNIRNALMRAYVNTRDFEAANELFEKMKTDETVTLLQYNEMLRICESSGDTECLERLYKELVERGFQPNIFTYLHRIRTYLANNQPEACIDIIEENIASKTSLLRVDVFMIVLRNLIPTGNIELVSKVVDLIKVHHVTKVPAKRLDHAMILVNVKAGNIHDASKLLPEKTPSEVGEEGFVEIELNPYRKVAKTASLEGDVDYIKNMIEFLKVNGLHYQTLDTFYLLALNKADDTEGIQRLYEERQHAGVEMTEKFLSILEAIIEDRGLKNFMVS